MKEMIDINDYAGLITKALPQGILLNTNGDKFNSMVIGWGHLGTLWGMSTFVVYVRQSRYTKGQLDKTGEFTISVPLDKINPVINHVCGVKSGYNIDKVEAAHLTLEEPEEIKTPGIKEYPLTLECTVLYSQDQDMEGIPEDIRARYYPEQDGKYDYHTMYVGLIEEAYIIR